MTRCDSATVGRMPAVAEPIPRPSIAARLVNEFRGQVLAAVGKLSNEKVNESVLAELVEEVLSCNTERPDKTTYFFGEDGRPRLRFTFKKNTDLFQKYMKELLLKGQWGTDGNDILVVFEWPEEGKVDPWVTHYLATLEKAITAFSDQLVDAGRELLEFAIRASDKKIELEVAFKEHGISKDPARGPHR